MKQTKIIMGMPITIEISKVNDQHPFDEIFDYFHQVDLRFSPYKKDSELTKINEGLPTEEWSSEMKEVMRLCEETKRITGGYFNIDKNGEIDTSGLVKGWSINNAADKLLSMGFKDFYVEAGGDIQVYGHNEDGEPWAIGIRNPFNIDQIVKVVKLSNKGIATSGTYIRGEHIYNPIENFSKPQHIMSLTVIAPNIFEADRFATAAFAMGKSGIAFIDALPEMEAYLIDDNQIATLSRGFMNYVA